MSRGTRLQLCQVFSPRCILNLYVYNALHFTKKATLYRRTLFHLIILPTVRNVFFDMMGCIMNNRPIQLDQPRS